MATGGVHLELGPDGATNKFALEGEVLMETVPVFPENDRTTGNQRRSDKINGGQQIIESLRNGIGYYKTIGIPPLDVNDPNGHPSFAGMFDSECETRWEGQITRPPKITAGTVTNASDSYKRLYSSVYGETIALTPEVNKTVGIWNASTDTMDVDKTVPSDGWGQHCAVDHEGFTYIFNGTGAGDIIYKFDGVNYVDLNPSTNPGVVFKTAVSYRGVLYGVGHDSTNGVLEIWKSVDDGDNWTQLLGTNVTERPRGRTTIAHLIEYLDANGQPALYLSTDRFLYIFDTIAEEIVPVVKWDDKVQDWSTQPRMPEPVTFDPEDGNGLRLYVARDAALYEIHYTGSRIDVSPFYRGNVPAKYIGSSARISAMVAGGGWLYVGYTFNTSSWVFAYDGFGFHYIMKPRSGVAGYADVGITSLALHKNVAGASSAYQLLVLYSTSGDDAAIDVIDDISLNPVQNTAAEYESSGFFILPWFDGGMSELDTAIVEYGLESINLDTLANNDDKIKFEIAGNYSETYETDSNKVITFYSDSSPVSRQKLVDGNGIAFRSWRIKVTISGGAAGTNVAMFYGSVSYNKKSPGIHRYTVVVNLKESVEMNRGKYQSPQDVLKAIHTSAQTIPLLDMRIMGSSIHADSTRRVELIEYPTFFNPTGSPNSYSPQIEDGNTRLVFMEMFPE